MIEVTPPQPSRLVAQPEQPLETGVLHPAGRLSFAASVEVEGCAYSDHDTRKGIPMISDPALLFWASESNEQDLSVRIRDFIDHFLILLRRERSKRRSEGEWNP